MAKTASSHSGAYPGFIPAESVDRLVLGPCRAVVKGAADIALRVVLADEMHVALIVGSHGQVEDRVCRPHFDD